MCIRNPYPTRHLPSIAVHCVPAVLQVAGLASSAIVSLFGFIRSNIWIDHPRLNKSNIPSLPDAGLQEHATIPSYKRQQKIDHAHFYMAAIL